MFRMSPFWRQCVSVCLAALTCQGYVHWSALWHWQPILLPCHLPATNLPKPECSGDSFLSPPQPLTLLRKDLILNLELMVILLPPKFCEYRCQPVDLATIIMWSGFWTILRSCFLWCKNNPASAGPQRAKGQFQQTITWVCRTQQDGRGPLMVQMLNINLTKQRKAHKTFPCWITSTCCRWKVFSGVNFLGFRYND